LHLVGILFPHINVFPPAVIRTTVPPARNLVTMPREEGTKRQQTCNTGNAASSVWKRKHP